MASSPLFSIASAIPNEGIVRPILRRNHTTNIRANAILLVKSERHNKYQLVLKEEGTLLRSVCITLASY